jgi:bacterioferritin-associated ferredoxin
MYVCICKAVTDTQILTAIDNGLCTRKKLMHCFGLGKDCGKCNPDVIALLQQNSNANAEIFSCQSNQEDEITKDSQSESFVPHTCQMPLETTITIQH